MFFASCIREFDSIARPIAIGYLPAEPSCELSREKRTVNGDEYREKSERRLVDWNGRPNNKIYSCYGYDGERNYVYKRSRYIHVTRVPSTSHVLLRRWPMRIWLRQKLMAADITSVKYEYAEAYKIVRERTK